MGAACSTEDAVTSRTAPQPRPDIVQAEGSAHGQLQHETLPPPPPPPPPRASGYTIGCAEGASGLVEWPISPTVLHTVSLKRRTAQVPPTFSLKLQHRAVTIRFVKDFASWVAQNEHAEKAPPAARPSAAGGVGPPPRASRPGTESLQLKTADLVAKYIQPATAHMPISFVEALCARTLNLNELEQTVPVFVSKFSHTDLHSALGLKDGKPPEAKYDPTAAAQEAFLHATSGISEAPSQSSASRGEEDKAEEEGEGGKGRRMYYVAHAWEADFFGLAGALENHCKSVVAANPDLSPADVLYWLDIFALDQSFEGDFTERPDTAIERLIIHNSRNLLLALVGPDITRPVALTRTWCLYETLVALLAGHAPEVIFEPSMRAHVLMADNLQHTPEVYFDIHFKQKFAALVSSINVITSKTTILEEREVMMRRMERHVGLVKATEKLKKAVQATCDIKALAAAMTLGVDEEVARLAKVKIPQRFAPLIKAAFVRAARLGHTEVVRTIMARGMDPNTYCNEFDGSALGKAITACHFDTAQALMLAGADVSAECMPSGGNALHACVVGAEVVDHDPYMAEGRAKQEQIEDMVQFAASLLFTGGTIDVDQGDHDGRTALHLACKTLCPPMVAMLLKHKADPRAKDLRQKTPWELAYATFKGEVQTFDDWSPEDHFEEDAFDDEPPTRNQQLKRRLVQIRDLLKAAKPASARTTPQQATKQA